MSRAWKTIKVPAELFDDLERLARRFEQAHDDGKSTLPPEYAERCPVHHVIARTVADFEAHRQRAARPRRSDRRNATSDHRAES